MKTLKFVALSVLAVVALSAVGEEEKISKAQEKVAKASPRNMKVLIAGFGTIESMTKVDSWLGDQVPKHSNLQQPPTLSQGDAIKNPDVARDIVRCNWNTRKLEYIRESNELAAENARMKRMLTELQTKVLSDDSKRYVPLAKDYLQAALSKRAGKLIQVIDRSNADMALVEQAISGDDSSALAGAGCFITVAMGDREEDSKIIPVNGKGTKVKRTIFTQPYVGKIRDLQGNVLTAFNGTSEWSSTQNNVVQSTVSDPARKLIESACDKIAAEIVAFFTTELQFKVKAPKGMDEDDVEITVDGRSVDADGVRVLAVEHALVAELSGCKRIRKIIEVEGGGSKKVLLKFQKKSKAAEDGDADDDE